jgi:hypothetical protein
VMAGASSLFASPPFGDPAWFLLPAAFRYTMNFNLSWAHSHKRLLCPHCHPTLLLDDLSGYFLICSKVSHLVGNHELTATTQGGRDPDKEGPNGSELSPHFIPSTKPFWQPGNFMMFFRLISKLSQIACFTLMVSQVEAISEKGTWVF